MLIYEIDRCGITKVKTITEDAIKKFPKGVKVVKPYLRYTPQPNVETT